MGTDEAGGAGDQHQSFNQMNGNRGSDPMSNPARDPATDQPQDIAKDTAKNTARNQAGDPEPQPPEQGAPAPRPKARAKPKAAREVVIKRLRRDEQFYIGGSECETREQLIAAFARKLRFPEWWTPDWHSFERCMLDLTWLQQPWPPRRICVLEMHDADYLLERGCESDLVAFFTIIERARRHSRLPFEFEGLVRKEAPMQRLRAAISIADRTLGPEGSRPFRIPRR